MVTELLKSKYQHKFDCVYVSSRAIGVLKEIPDNAMLGLLKSKQSILAIESAKYIANVPKQQKIDLVAKLNTLVTTKHGLNSIPGNNSSVVVYAYILLYGINGTCSLLR